MAQTPSIFEVAQCTRDTCEGVIVSSGTKTTMKTLSWHISVSSPRNLLCLHHRHATEREKDRGTSVDGLWSSSSVNVESLFPWIRQIHGSGCISSDGEPEIISRSRLRCQSQGYSSLRTVPLFSMAGILFLFLSIFPPYAFDYRHRIQALTAGLARNGRNCCRS
ncbi:hypothetical protein ACLOJK_032221 [Asimina triloba]